MLKHRIELPGLYIHVPFCKTKCPYCDFASTTDLSLIPRWLDAVDREMALYRDTFSSFDTVFLGGGTPSMLGADGIEKLILSLRNHCELLPDTEFTCEVNPDDVTVGLLKVLLSCGVNRLSIGIQSFDDTELAFLGRRHSAKGAEDAVRQARAAGFSNIGIDFIYGLPGQSTKNWLATLEKTLSLNPSHLSCYQLTIAGDTPFGTLTALGELTPVCEDAERSFFIITSRYLTRHSFIHYEVSNFSPSETLFCRHNMKYWRHAPYLGIGPSAHSFDGGNRWWNKKSVPDYCAALEAGEKPVESMETLTVDQIDLERLMVGFRTRDGVSVDELSKSVSKDALRRLCDTGYVKVTDGRIRPTRKGLLMADRLPLMLF